MVGHDMAFVSAIALRGIGNVGERKNRCHLHMRQRVDANGEEYITLESFLKVQGVAETGGRAKLMIRSGEVAVNGQREERRGRKLREGDAVQIGEGTISVSFVGDEES